MVAALDNAGPQEGALLGVAVVDEADEAADEAANEAALVARLSSPMAMSSPVGTPSDRIVGVATGVEAVGGPTREPGVQGVPEESAVPAEDVIARRQRLIQWLSGRCLYCYIYCVITKARPSRREHWHEDCRRSESIPDDPSHDEAVDFQIEMDAFRTGVCHSCGKGIAECGGRSSVAVTCEYADIMVHTVFMLHRAGWLKAWLQREGYQVSFGYVSLQTWLSEPSDKGGVNRNRVVEAFEAYAMEVGELE